MVGTGGGLMIVVATSHKVVIIRILEERTITLHKRLAVPYKTPTSIRS